MRSGAEEEATLGSARQDDPTSDAVEGQDSQSRVTLQPIEHQSSLASIAYDHIKAAIIVGQITPGKLYTVNQFASALGISRTPVREALLILAQQGLLEMERNRGFRVGGVSEKSLEEIIEIRRMLEVPAMQRLAELQPPPTAVIDSARELYIELRISAEQGNLLEFLRLDRVFHLTLVEALGNQRLTTLIGDLRDHMHLPGLRYLAEQQNLDESTRDHERLLDALDAADGIAAAAIMDHHLNRARGEWH